RDSCKKQPKVSQLAVSKGFLTNPCRASIRRPPRPHVGDVSGQAYCTVRGVAALDVFVCSPEAVSADLAALVVA
ncbi:hypothetical protein LN543_14215, partial [Xanthomonas hortorum pv. gardneri]|nr:hypothetical protein [Xanthomonas hortorum pv. gardneri]